MLPIEEKYDLDFDFEKGRLILAQGAELYVESPEGTFNFQCNNKKLHTKIQLF